MSYTPEQLALATSQESAVTVADYPYGFNLRCSMRVWIEFKKGRGFRYCTQTTNPKKPGTVWNKPKAGTYSKVSMAIGEDARGHLFPASLSEYSSLPEYAAFMAEHGPALSPDALASAAYYREVKTAYETALQGQGLSSIYDATPEQRSAVTREWMGVCAAHHKAGTAY